MLLILIPSEFLLYLGVLGRLGANANQFQIYPYSDPCRWVGVVLWLREYEEVPSAWIGMQQVL